MSDPFRDNPDLVACAQIVEKGDPERFQAVMAAPVDARAMLFPIYASNIEIARAPWASKEPLIVQMRLQWWSDALDEIEAGGMVRRHEVVTPLAMALPSVAVAPMRRVVEARPADLDRVPFADETAFLAYLDATAGGIAEAAVLSLGSTVPDGLRLWARATGFVRYLQAVQELEARGKQPLPDGRPSSLARMAQDRLSEVSKAGSLRALRRSLGPAGPAVLEFWQTRGLLKLLARDPAAVANGRLRLSEFSRRARLLHLGL